MNSEPTEKDVKAFNEMMNTLKANIGSAEQCKRHADVQELRVNIKFMVAHKGLDEAKMDKLFEKEWADFYNATIKDDMIAAHNHLTFIEKEIEKMVSEKGLF